MDENLSILAKIRNFSKFRLEGARATLLKVESSGCLTENEKTRIKNISTYLETALLSEWNKGSEELGLKPKEKKEGEKNAS